MATPKIDRLVGFPAALTLKRRTTGDCSSDPRRSGADVTIDPGKRVRMELALPPTSRLRFGHNGRRRTGRNFPTGARRPRLSWWLVGPCGVEVAVTITVTVSYVDEPTKRHSRGTVVALIYTS